MGNICCKDDEENSRGKGKASVTRLKTPSSGSFKGYKDGCSLDEKVHKETKTPNIKNFKSLKKIESIKDHYDLDKQLGKGSYGIVYKATNKITNETVAIKSIRKSNLKQKVLRELMLQELDVLKMSSHPNIMTVHELLEDENYYYIVSELLEGGELFDRIIKVGCYKEKKAAFILKQVLMAVNYLHN